MCTGCNVSRTLHPFDPHHVTFNPSSSSRHESRESIRPLLTFGPALGEELGLLLKLSPARMRASLLLLGWALGSEQGELLGAPLTLGPELGGPLALGPDEEPHSNSAACWGRKQARCSHSVRHSTKSADCRSRSAPHCYLLPGVRLRAGEARDW
jgi:hypothetical protein